MVIEKSYINEEDRKRKELSEKEQNQELKKQAEFQKTKEEINIEIEAEEEIFHLKELVEKGIISRETAKKIVNENEIDEKTIKEIFEKISEIEGIKDVDNYLPKDLRINQQDYTKAIHDDIFREETIKKLDSALSVLSRQINGGQIGSINIFSGFLNILDKNLIIIQEHTIDIKDNLEDLGKKTKIKKSIWERFLDFLKELLN